VKGFTDAGEALAYLRVHPVDIALLDINMPGTDGITLASRIKQIRPKTSILFLTAYKEYAFDAYAVHPAGYLLKPVSLEKLAAEIAYAHRSEVPSVSPHIFIKAFGYFDVYADGRPIALKLAKSKEILAVFVDKQGFGVSRPELCATIWEDQLYDRRMQKHLDVYIRSLRDTLRKYGAQAILQMERGILRVDPNSFDCDVYRFYSGDSEAVNAYHGEYMSAYSWASMTEGILFWTTKNKT
jgi:two-component SAPR family response regulator